MINTYPQNPCKECRARHAECHATCDEYTSWRKDADVLRDERMKKLLFEEAMTDAIKNRFNKYWNMRNRKEKRKK